MSIHNPFSFHGFNSLTIWSQICCVYFDKFFPSLGFCFSGDFQTNKQVIWPCGGDRGRVAWATSWWIGKNQTGDWDPTFWAILDDSLTPPVVHRLPIDFCASQGVYVSSQP